MPATRRYSTTADAARLRKGPDEAGLRIAVLNLNETRRDPRVRRITGSLQKAGHHVRVFEMRSNGLDAAETFDGLEIERVPLPTDFRPRPYD